MQVLNETAKGILFLQDGHIWFANILNMAVVGTGALYKKQRVFF